MAHIMGNVGLAKDLRQRTAQALDTGTTLFLVLDQVRTVAISDTTVIPNEELVVTCSDIVDGTTVILHLPYASESVASATIIHYTEGGA